MKSLIKIITVAVVIVGTIFSSIAYALEPANQASSSEMFLARIVEKQVRLIEIRQDREELTRAITNVLFAAEQNTADKMFLERIQKKNAGLANMKSEREEFARILGKPLVSDARFVDRLEYKANAIAAK